MKTLKFKTKILSLIILTVISVFIISGCRDNVVNTTADNVDLSAISTIDTTDVIGILRLDTVKILIKDIKLNVANNNQDSNNFKVGPFVLYLNLQSQINFISTAYIPAGTYDKVRFMVHKLENNETPPDPDFVLLNERMSVVVKGSYNNVPFIYRSTKSAHQKLSFPNSLQVSETGKSNITLKVSPYIWFIENGVYLDPTDEDNRNNIDNNIKNNINNNFKIFVDNDRNGNPD
ncbi:MAG: hypothetical protein M3P82_07145 [Bacteroidota bacterium]|nr:hypothetical protein [Bacteroidota bacterium]